MRTARTLVVIAATTLVAVTPVALGAATSTISALGWMAGCWTGAADGVTTEEHWTSAEGGAMLGMNKAVRDDGRLASFEFLRIAGDGERICYFGSPGGAPPTPFCTAEVGASSVTFENPEHDVPQRIADRRDGDLLHARVEGTIDGKLQAQTWTWHRCTAATP
jgi:hypothetical protein